MKNEIVKTEKVKIGGREFTLGFTLRALIRMQNRIEGFNFNEIDRFVASPEGLVTTLYVLAENGAKLEGKTLDVDQDWFELHIPANRKKMMEITIAIMNTLTYGMAMETEEDEEHGKEVDVVLEEIQKKSGKTD